MSDESRGGLWEFQGGEAPGFAAGFISQEERFSATFGMRLKLKPPVGITVRFFVMQFRKLSCRSERKSYNSRKECNDKQPATGESTLEVIRKNQSQIFRGGRQKRQAERKAGHPNRKGKVIANSTTRVYHRKGLLFRQKSKCNSKEQKRQGYEDEVSSSEVSRSSENRICVSFGYLFS
jgi:hypothetical protein